MAKAGRILSMYDRLMEGGILIKSEEAERFRVGERTIQRDLDDIRAHLQEGKQEDTELVYDKRKKGYILKNNHYRH